MAYFPEKNYIRRASSLRAKRGEGKLHFSTISTLFYVFFCARRTCNLKVAHVLAYTYPGNCVLACGARGKNRTMVFFLVQGYAGKLHFCARSARRMETSSSSHINTWRKVHLCVRSAVCFLRGFVFLLIFNVFSAFEPVLF